MKNVNGIQDILGDIGYFDEIKWDIEWEKCS